MSKKPLAIIALLVIVVAALAGAYMYARKSAPIVLAPDEQTVEGTPEPANAVPAGTTNPASSISPIQQTMLATSPTPSSTPSPITAIIVTDTGSPTTVTPADSKLTLPASTAQIKVIVQLAPTTTATTAVLKMTYFADDSVLGPISSPIKTVGDKKLAAFGLNKPPAGWPNGPYSLLVVLPTGESKELTFVIQ